MSKKEFTAEHEQALADWLRINDRELWAGKKRIKDAIAMFTKETGIECPKSAPGRLRKDVCKWWGSEPLPRASQARALNERQWTRLSTFLRDNWDSIKGASDDFLVRYLRRHRLPVNQRILSGCATLNELRARSTTDGV